MANHLTPAELAVALARYAPKEIRHLLDPAVGTGALLLPFCDSKHAVHRVTAIDKRRSILPSLRRIAEKGFSSNFDFVLADFLRWASHAEEQGKKFDCIVMNPPFSGRSRKHAAVLLKPVDRALCTLPIELAFLVKSLRILEPSGRLLAILPSSAIATSGTSSVRRLLLKEGSILAVQEIPQNSFKGVDGHIYLLAFQKNIQRQTFVLCNSDLFKPRKIFVAFDDLGPALRLDYSYHKARQIGQEFHVDHQLGWSPLASVATVMRGSIESPIDQKYVLHTIHRQGPFWSATKLPAGGSKEIIATQSDIVMSRVGRNCIQTAGIIVNSKSCVISDCIHLIRPHCRRDRNRILFALRIAVKMAHAKGLLERGTGAAYITQNCLRDFQIPLNLSTKYLSQYRHYTRAISKGRADRMEDIEARILTGLGQ